MDRTGSVCLRNARGRFAGTIDNQESQAVALEKLRGLLAAG